MRLTPSCLWLAAAFLGGAGGAPALALDDTSTMSSVLGFLGVPTEEPTERIVYRERSKLVLPPSRPSLPEPRERGESRPASWPVDQEVVHKRGSQAPVRQVGLNENPNSAADVAHQQQRRGKCLIAGSDGDCTSFFDKSEAQSQPKMRKPGEATTRSFLTEPPTGYREQVAGGKGIQEKEEAGWSNPVGFIGEKVSGIFGN
jgi:hypothetical protein